MKNLQLIADSLLEVQETVLQLRRIIMNGWVVELDDGDDGERYKSWYGRLELIAEHADVGEAAIERARQSLHNRIPVEIERSVRFDLSPEAVWLDLRRYWQESDAKLIGMLESIAADAWNAYATTQIHARRNRPKKQLTPEERDKEVRKMLREDPTPTAQEIADRLDCAKSTVLLTTAWKRRPNAKQRARPGVVRMHADAQPGVVSREEELAALIDASNRDNDADRKGLPDRMYAEL